MRNAGLEEAQAGIKIAGRNINNLRYADDITLMSERKEKLKILLMKVKEEEKKKKVKEESEKAGFKLNILKTKIMASIPSLLGKHGETKETVRDYFLGLQNHCRR